MVFSTSARISLLVVLGLALAGCAKEDGSRIVGRWHAERFEVMSLKLPVGPKLEITRKELSTGSEVRIPIAAITQDGDEVTLETDGAIGLTFVFVESDRMYFELPVVGRIYYRRINPSAVAVAASAIANDDVGRKMVIVPPTLVAAPRAQAAQPPLPEPVEAIGARQLAVQEPAFAKDYAQALALARQGDRDGAIRCLFDAFIHGFRDVALLAATPEFDILASDVRYQALLARYH